MKIDSNTGDVLPSNKVLELFEKLYLYSQASAELKQAHVDGINNRLQQKNQDAKTILEPSESEINAVDEQSQKGRCSVPSAVHHWCCGWLKRAKM